MGVKPAVGPYQSYFLVFEDFKRFIDERLGIAQCGSVARPKPCVGHHPSFGYEGHERVMGGAPGLIWVIPYLAPFLSPVTCHHGTIKIQRDIFYLQVIDKPFLQRHKHFGIGFQLNF